MFVVAAAANIGVDTAENEPLKICLCIYAPPILNHLFRSAFVSVAGSSIVGHLKDALSLKDGDKFYSSLANSIRYADTNFHILFIYSFERSVLSSREPDPRD